jgi:hypothetical protein
VAIGPPLETISAGDAAHEIDVVRHALGADHAGHPLRQAVAQQAEVVPVQLGRVGFFQRQRVHGCDHGMAVVLVEAGPLQGFEIQPHAFANTFPGLCVAAQRAGQHGVQRQTLARQVLAQAHALAPAELAELVIVVCAKRGLAVAHKVKGSHGPHGERAGRAALSPVRRESRA